MAVWLLGTVACGSKPSGTSSPSSQVSSTAPAPATVNQSATTASAPQGQETAGESPEIGSLAPGQIETLRQMAFDYWDAFNFQDADAVLAFMDESYRDLREEEIRQEVGLLRQFGVTLGLKEQVPPHAVGEGQAEMFLLMTEPLGVRIIRMAFIDRGSGWRVTYAKEIE